MELTHKLPKNWFLARISKRLTSTVGVLAAAGAIGGLIGGGVISIPSTTTTATTTTINTTAVANAWVGNPGTCSATGGLVSYNAGTACSTAAAAVASLPATGGLIRVKCGSYTSTEVLTRTTLTGDATITSETPNIGRGGCAIYNRAGGDAAFNFGINVSHVILDHLEIEGRVVFATAFSGSEQHQDNDQITNNVIQNGHITSGQPIVYNSGSGLHIVNNSIGPSCCGFNNGSGNSPEGIRIGKSSPMNTRLNANQTISSGGTLTVLACNSVITSDCGTNSLLSSGHFIFAGTQYTYTGKTGTTVTGISPGGTFTADSGGTCNTATGQFCAGFYNPPECFNQACNVTITDNLITYVVRDCALWPANSNGGLCPDTTCTNANGCHQDGIHIWGVEGADISRNTMYGDECQGIFLENTNNNLNSNVNIVGNAVSSLAGNCSNKGIYLSASGSTDGFVGFTGTWKVGFNSGGASIIGANGCGSCFNMTINFYGNDMPQFFTNSGGNGAGCGSGSFGSATVHFEYNIWRTGTACGANDIVASPAFVNDAPAPAINLSDHLGATGVADNFVPCSSLVFSTCPATDIDGNSFTSIADAGAFQR